MQTLTLTRATNLFSQHQDDRYLGLSNHRLCFLSVHPASPPPLLASKRHRLKLAFVAKAADSTQPSSATTSADKTLVPDDEFTLAKVSFGVIGLGLGISLLSYGFGAYFSIFPGSEWSALMLTYGFPLAVIGMALKYAELKPVPCLTYSDAQSLRETCATPILKQVRNDVIRFRYGDEQHLDEALKRIFQYGLGGGIPRRSAPVLQMIREENPPFPPYGANVGQHGHREVVSPIPLPRGINSRKIPQAQPLELPLRMKVEVSVLTYVTEDGKYCLVLVFEAKALKLSDFEKRQAKFTSFFGPGITAAVGCLSHQDLVRQATWCDRQPVAPTLGATGNLSHQLLLGSCKIHRNVEIGEIAMKNLVQLEAASAGDYVLLATIYACTKDEEGVARTRKLIKSNGIKTTPSWSWIEIGNQVHKFVVDDKSHPDTDVIYRKLEEIMHRAKFIGYTKDESLLAVSGSSSEDFLEKSSAYHSEKLAIAFGLATTPDGTSLRIVKNLRVCRDCHSFTKFVSRAYSRDLITSLSRSPDSEDSGYEAQDLQ
ncbi:Acclimation of photosynthesis to environment [Citrus sinensis]|uniref:Acclimation of photosynthesis to environment n=1 Tax=Citrus sinensis TaxID=2711 RepID=A0ACB8K415_CITSI|nr:Acclimation of photosynthesis to environment [Citrus sinensis]